MSNERDSKSAAHPPKGETMRRPRLGKFLAGATAGGLVVLAAWGQQKPTPIDVGDLDKETVQKAFKKPYSLYAGRTYPTGQVRTRGAPGHRVRLADVSIKCAGELTRGRVPTEAAAPGETAARITKGVEAPCSRNREWLVSSAGTVSSSCSAFW
jgi:hypothetical protein